jgi:hypothetical protein
MDNFIGEELFIVVGEEDTITELSFYTEIEHAAEHLKLVDPVDEPDTKVFHGILTRADSIPSNIKSKSCYIIVVNSVYAGNCAQGVIYQSECENDSDILARDIEDAVVQSGYHSVFVSNIEDIYILYGYEVGTGMCINEESLDEEVIHTCKTIAVKANAIREAYLND